MKNCKNVASLVDSFHSSRFNHVLKSERDYIKTPKEDGYRGYHLVYQYQSLPDQIAAYDKLRIEIQIRSAMQHAWATAVEAVGAFTQQALKAAQGSEDWLRLFALMGTAIAMMEKAPLCPGTPSDMDELRKELQDIANRLNAEHILGAYRSALNYFGGLKEKSSKYFLVHYDSAAHKVWVSGFAANASEQANFAYTKAESSKKPMDNIVLVSVGSLKSLIRAYPNYFLDTAQFATILSNVLRPPVKAETVKPASS